MLTSTLTTKVSMIHIFVVCFLVVGSLAHPKCCEEDNFIANGSCIDGSEINIATKECNARIILDNFEYTVAENYSLVVIDKIFPHTYTSDEYCITEMYDTKDEIAIVCDNSTEEPMGFSYNWRAACAFVSVIFIFLTVLVYFLVPQLRDLQGKSIIHSLFSLGIAFFTLALAQVNSNFSQSTCIFIAFLVYTSFLLAFFWLNVVAVNMWRKIMKPDMWNKTDTHWYIIYCVYAYGMTAVFVLTAIITHNTEGNHIQPRFGEGSCFFNGDKPTWVYFYGPISVLLVVNVVLFSWSIKVLWSDSDEQNCPRLKTSKYRCLLTLKLFFIMGLFWIFEVTSFALQGVHTTLDQIWIFTDYLNSIQGVLIFLVLVVFRRKALKGLASNSCLGSRLPRSWQTLEDEECLEEEEARYSNV